LRYCPQILAARPDELVQAVRNSRESKHGRVATLAAWLVQNIPIRPTNAGLGLGVRDGLIDHDAELGRRPVEAVLASLASYDGCVLCGGMALLMFETLRKASFSVALVNVGELGVGRASHVLAFVDVGAPGQMRWGVYDPFLGLYIGTEASSTNLADILDALRAGHGGTLRFARLGPRWKPALATRDYLDRAHPANLGITRYRNLQQLPYGSMRFEVDLRAYGAAFARQVKQSLAHRIPDATALDLLRFPISNSGGADAVAIAAALASCTPQGFGRNDDPDVLTPVVQADSSWPSDGNSA
jgi:hypothetical protein